MSYATLTVLRSLRHIPLNKLVMLTRCLDVVCSVYFLLVSFILFFFSVVVHHVKKPRTHIVVLFPRFTESDTFLVHGTAVSYSLHGKIEVTRKGTNQQQQHLALLIRVQQ